MEFMFGYASAFNETFQLGMCQVLQAWKTCLLRRYSTQTFQIGMSQACENGGMFNRALSFNATFELGCF